MKNFSRKFLAILLIVAVLTTFPMVGTVNAVEETEETAKQTLISAWQTLAAETKEATIQVGGPSTSNENQEEVTDATDVGIDNAFLGTHFVNKGPKENTYYQKKDEEVFNENTASSFKELYFSACLYDADGNVVSSYVETYIDNASPLKTAVDGWTKVSYSNVVYGGFSLKANYSAVSTISYGSLWGVKDVNGPALPDNYASMTLAELVAAAKEIDYEGFNGTEDFKAALANAENEALKETLVLAWQTLETDTK